MECSPGLISHGRYVSKQFVTKGAPALSSRLNAGEICKAVLERMMVKMHFP